MRNAIFRYPQDRIPVAIVLGTSLLSFALYCWVDSIWALGAYWLVMLIPRGAIASWNHHHQHVFTFHSTALNRLLEFGYALHTGLGTHGWVLHHVLGHHQNYLDQTVDQSRWRYRNGRPMGVFAYTLIVAGTSYWRAYQVGRNYPRQRQSFLIFGGLTLGAVAAMVISRPIPGLLVFVLPMISTLLWTAWATYDHHAGLPTDSTWVASYNIESRLYNWLTCNLGYHTAHHHRPGVHWSQLKDLHAKIRHRIPDHLVRTWRGTWLRTSAPTGFAQPETPRPKDPTD